MGRESPVAFLAEMMVKTAGFLPDSGPESRITISHGIISYQPLPCPAMNSLFAIAPYKFQGFWVFDDPAAGLKQEPFVSGADTILDVLTGSIPGAADGFRLVFSAQPFPGFTASFEWLRPEHGGNWYVWKEKDMEGWLCPALFQYFETAPPEIYVRVSAK